MGLGRRLPNGHHPPEAPIGSSYVDTAGNTFVHNGEEWQPLHGRDIAHSLQTYTGRFFWPLQPRADEVTVEDVAAGLSREFRYGNHSPHPYPVAWHCVALSHVVPASLRPFALVHDAPEAYIKDMPRTIRSQEPFKSMYERIHWTLLLECCEFFGIEEQEDELHEYDVRMSHSEMIVWSEFNPVFMAKLIALDIDLTTACDEEWLAWVRSCPTRNMVEESMEAWLERYDELF